MKNIKRYASILGVSAMILGTVTACGRNADSGDIGKEKASQIAFDDAGVSQEDSTRLRISQDWDDGRTVYEIQFDNGGIEYDYEVQASDGKILSASTENIPQNTTAGNEVNTSTDNTSQTEQPAQNAANEATISQVEAAKLALERVPGAAETDLRIELDRDDGYLKYEGDIIYDQKEYDFEIDAANGNFLEWSEERR